MKKPKPKRVDVKAWACVTKRGRIRYISLGHRDAWLSGVPDMGDRIARCRLTEITKKKRSKP